MGKEGCTALDFIMDLTFAVGFGFLAFWWLFKVRVASSKNVTTTEIAVLCGYYIFFSLFMAAAAFRVPLIMRHCGFLDHPMYKSAFYLMLATFAIPDLSLEVNDIVGGVFAGMAILNLVNLLGCCKKKEVEA